MVSLSGVRLTALLLGSVRVMKVFIRSVRLTALLLGSVRVMKVFIEPWRSIFIRMRC